MSNAVATGTAITHNPKGVTMTVQLPPLRARNHAEAVAALQDRRARLLAHAAELADRASLFTDTPDVFDMLTAEVRALLAQADKCLPRSHRH